MPSIVPIRGQAIAGPAVRWADRHHSLRRWIVTLTRSAYVQVRCAVFALWSERHQRYAARTRPETSNLTQDSGFAGCSLLVGRALSRDALTLAGNTITNPGPVAFGRQAMTVGSDLSVTADGTAPAPTDETAAPPAENSAATPSAETASETTPHSSALSTPPEETVSSVQSTEPKPGLTTDDSVPAGMTTQ
jgi:hypothetical protein